jgi:hypothetical protein
MWMRRRSAYSCERRSSTVRASARSSQTSPGDDKNILRSRRELSFFAPTFLAISYVSPRRTVLAEVVQEPGKRRFFRTGSVAEVSFRERGASECRSKRASRSRPSRIPGPPLPIACSREPARPLDHLPPDEQHAAPERDRAFHQQGGLEIFQTSRKERPLQKTPRAMDPVRTTQSPTLGQVLRHRGQIGILDDPDRARLLRHHVLAAFRMAIELVQELA